MNATFKIGQHKAFDDPSWIEAPPFVQNFTQLFLSRVAASGEKDALYEKRFGLWEPLTWSGYGERAAMIGHGLMTLGLGKGDVVSILAQNSIDWVAVDMGTLGMGGVCSGIYPTDSAAQVEYLLKDSDTRVIFVEDEEQLDKVLLGRKRCPRLSKVVVLDTKGLSHFSDPMVTSLSAFLELGRDHAAKHPGAWHDAAARQTPDDPAIIVYTSGTTGPAKGALVTHRSLLFICYSARQNFDRRDGDTLLSFLPLCHMAERVVGSYLQIMCENILYFAESMETVPENLREVQPHFVLAVPRIWEKLYSQVNVALRDGVPLQRWLYATPLAAGARMTLAAEAGKPTAMLDRIVFKLGEWLVLRNLKRMLGLSRVHSLLTGAAPISPDLVRWYRSIGLRVQEAYGQTESTCFLTVTPRDATRPGTVGKPIAGCEIRMSSEGEILARGPNIFREYLNKPDKTAEAIEDGWLHTGDVGCLDPDGTLRIVDRLKDIIITAGGKNITPSEIENQIKFSPYVSDAILIGDRKPFLCCLVMIDQENVAKFAQEQNVPFSNFASLTRAPEVMKLVAGEIERVNAQFARVEQVKQFRIIDRVLTPEDEEITPTMKLKRKLVHQKFSTLIDEIDSPEDRSRTVSKYNEESYNMNVHVAAADQILPRNLFAGKTIFVTGGGSGINLGIARTFASLGAKIAICGRSQARLDEAAAGLRAQGADVVAKSADVRVPEQLQSAFDVTREALGDISVLICGAAGNFLAHGETLSPNGFKTIVDIDLIGSFNAARLAFEQLKLTRGSILFITAPMGHMAHAYQAHVGPAKAGVEMLMKNLALEWGPHGIRSNSIIPGFVEDTEGLRRISAKDGSGRFVRNVPLRRMGTVSEIGLAAAFLASPLAAYITGTSLWVDGGQALAGSAFFNDNGAAFLAQAPDGSRSPP